MKKNAATCIQFILILILCLNGVRIDENADQVGKPFYYQSTTYPTQTVRLELDGPSVLRSMDISLYGKGVGRFNVKVYGHEGGASYPILSEPLVVKDAVVKDSIGFQLVRYTLEEPLELSDDYFFVQLDQFEGEMGILCDSSKNSLCDPLGNGILTAPLIVQDTLGVLNYEMVNPRIKVELEPVQVDSSLFKEFDICAFCPKLSPGQSISWGDVNQDDWVDLLIGNHLWINNSGVLDKPEIFDSKARHSCFIDFDNDSDLDILLFGKNGILLFSNDSMKYAFTKRFQEFEIWKPQAICVSDFNKDSFPDVFVTQLWSKYPKPLPNYLFVNAAGKSLKDTSSLLYPDYDGDNNFPHNCEMIDDSETYDSSPNVSLNKRTRAAQFVDYDIDGDQDLYVVNYFLEEDEWYENIGGGQFFQQRTPIDSITSSDSKYKKNYFNNGTGISWADYDNDGDIDYVLSQLTHPNNILAYGHLGTTLFENTADGFISVEDNGGVKYEETHAGVIFGDLNNDGLADLITASYYNCRYMDVYLQKEDHTFEMKTFESGLHKISNVHDICVVDYNNDGKQDICFIQDDTFRMFENNIENDNNWLKVRLRAKTINTYGIGATVRVYCGEDVYTKQLYSGEGQGMQSPLILHFGLSQHAIVDRIEVMWDAGKSQALHDVNVNQLIVIEEN